MFKIVSRRELEGEPPNRVTRHAANDRFCNRWPLVRSLTDVGRGREPPFGTTGGSSATAAMASNALVSVHYVVAIAVARTFALASLNIADRYAGPTAILVALAFAQTGRFVADRSVRVRRAWRILARANAGSIVAPGAGVSADHDGFAAAESVNGDCIRNRKLTPVGPGVGRSCNSGALAGPGDVHACFPAEQEAIGIRRAVRKPEACTRNAFGIRQTRLGEPFTPIRRRIAAEALIGCSHQTILVLTASFRTLLIQTVSTRSSAAIHSRRSRKGAVSRRGVESRKTAGRSRAAVLADVGLALFDTQAIRDKHASRANGDQLNPHSISHGVSPHMRIFAVESSAPSN